VENEIDERLQYLLYLLAEPPQKNYSFLSIIPIFCNVVVLGAGKYAYVDGCC